MHAKYMALVLLSFYDIERFLTKIIVYYVIKRKSNKHQLNINSYYLKIVVAVKNINLKTQNQKDKVISKLCI